jgi:hypothetical protein
MLSGVAERALKALASTAAGALSEPRTAVGLYGGF